VVIKNAGPASLGNGTVIVKGGNLLFNSNVTYETSFAPLISPAQMASIGWVVLDEVDPAVPTFGQRGNVYVHKDVQKLAGNFMIGGQNGFSTVSGTDTDSPNPLTVYGLIVARQFHMSRSFLSKDRGSEQVIYDGRAVVNPPPGFQDLTKALPWFGKAPAVQQ
jgi:hypothetical protein